MLNNKFACRDVSTALNCGWRLSACYKIFNTQIIARDKTSLNIAWLKNKSLADLDNLPDPDELAQEIAENLKSELHGFRIIVEKLKKSISKSYKNFFLIQHKLKDDSDCPFCPGLSYKYLHL